MPNLPLLLLLISVLILISFSFLLLVLLAISNCNLELVSLNMNYFNMLSHIPSQLRGRISLKLLKVGVKMRGQIRVKLGVNLAAEPKSS